MNNRTAVGFRIKSGWTIAVLVEEAAGSLLIVDRQRVELSDPADPHLRQPYHADFGVGLTDSVVLMDRVRAIERFSARSLADLLTRYAKAGHTLCGAGLVVGSDADPERIPNQHIRAHASEGRLFRRVVEDAMRRDGLICAIWVERSLYAVAAQRLGRSEGQVRQVVAAAGRHVDGGWRSDDKTAATGAWLALAATGV